MMQATAGVSAAGPATAAVAAAETAGASGGPAPAGGEAAATTDAFAALLESASACAAAPASQARIADTPATETEAHKAVKETEPGNPSNAGAALSLLTAPLLMLQDRGASSRTASPASPGAIGATGGPAAAALADGVLARPGAGASAAMAAAGALSASALRSAIAHGLAPHARDGAALLPGAGGTDTTQHAAHATGAQELARNPHLQPGELQLDQIPPAAAAHGTQAASSFGLALAAADPTLQRPSPASGPDHAGTAPATMALLAAPASLVVDAPVVHHATLPSQPFDAAFAGDLAAEVRLMAASGLQRAELHLNPPDLGPIHIQLSVSSQTADISFAVSHAATRDGIAQALPALRDMLAGQGLSLGQAGVSSQHPGQPSSDGRQFAAHAPRGSAAIHGGSAAPAHGAPISLSIRRGRGMLDLYA